MATGGMDGDIPRGEELTLRNLLNAPAIVKVVDWKEVGLELGVEEHELEKIDRECRGIMYDCKRRMFSYWLKNSLKRTWEEVSHAVKTVAEGKTKQKERETIRETIEKEEAKAVETADQLPRSLHELGISDKKIETEQTKLSKELEERNKLWESTQKEWESEDREWEMGEKSRQQTQTALRREGKNSQLVQQFMQEKGLAANMSGEDVDHNLRKDILEKQVDRSKQLRLRYQKGRIHHADVKSLQNECEEWKNLIGRRVQAYNKILECLKKVGLNEEELKVLKRQLDELTSTLEKYTSAIEQRCETALMKVNEDLKECKQQLEAFSRSFDEIIQEMEKKYGEFEAADLTTTGVIVGTTAGTIVLPVIGTTLGGVAGGIIGGVAGLGIAALGWQGTQKTTTELHDFKQAGKRAKEELDCLNKLFKQE